MPRGPRVSTSEQGITQLSLIDQQEYLKTAPCVPLLRRLVREWRAQGYPGATEISRQLLTWWFETDHQLADHRPFAYHESQRVAIETLIYVYEVAKTRTRHALLEAFARDAGEIRLPPEDDFARYCVKMATGSGKTKVMSLAIVWQYWNAIQGANDQDYARTFLIVAPNVIVLERLKADFANGKIFQTDPLMPPSLRYFWDAQTMVRGDSERPNSAGLILLTNIQQLYERPNRNDEQETDALAAVLGPKGPPPQSEGADFADVIARRDGKLLVLNDEAHHTHDEGSMWNTVIHNLHDSTPIASQLDFSATPRFQKGSLFPWVISDYPLKQAIIDGVVKRPYKGVADIPEVPSDHATIKYEGFIVAAANRWREYREQLAGVGKRPLLFIMLNSVDDAEDVGAALREKWPEDFAGERTLIIHTKADGELRGEGKNKDDLAQARKLVQQVDDAASPVNAIVSVLMLREGWDVQNVTVVLGLRPYTAKANILPEQTIGRGLRLMFRGQSVGYTERVDIIGNKAFLDFVEQLDTLEQLELGTYKVGDEKLTILTIQPDDAKRDYDIAIPQLSPMLARKKSLGEEIASLNVQAFVCPPLPRTRGDAAERHFRYEGRDFLTMEKEFEREYDIPTPQTAGEIIGYHARLIAKDLKLPAQFAALAPKVREFFETKAFGGAVDLDDPTIIQAMSRPPVIYITKRLFGDALRDKIVEGLEPTLQGEPRRLSEALPFPFSDTRNALAGRKCILNYAPCTNAFERGFGAFLDGASDVMAWCKVPDSFKFYIEYTDQRASLRYYYPDFIAVTDDGGHWIVETKGAETVEVVHKDRAAQLWCENATRLTGETWRYLKVPQKDFNDLQPTTFADLTLLG